jgi:hypothetical protein
MHRQSDPAELLRELRAKRAARENAGASINRGVLPQEAVDSVTLRSEFMTSAELKVHD